MNETAKIQELESQVSELESRIMKLKMAKKQRSEKLTLLDCIKCEYPKCNMTSECTYSVV